MSTTGTSVSAIRLAGFVTTDVRQFVALAVENYSRLAPSYVAAMGVALQAAWRETEQWFAIAEEQILALTDDQLAAHDLAGATLEVKLEAVQLATGQAIEVLRNPSPLPESRWKWLRKKFKWTADGIDNVLDSLEPLVPIVGPIKEIKHHIGWIADAPEEEGSPRPPSGTPEEPKEHPSGKYSDLPKRIDF